MILKCNFFIISIILEVNWTLLLHEISYSIFQNSAVSEVLQFDARIDATNHVEFNTIIGLNK